MAMVTELQYRPLTIEERAAAASIPGDLSIYAKAVHNLELEPYQLAWEQALEIEDRTVIVCPPDTFKSTTVQNWVERSIGLNKNIRILWLMNAGEQAEKRVMAVGSTIDSNPVFRATYPGVKPNKDAQWTKSVLYVHREPEDLNSADPTLMGAGLNGAYQGLHFDVIVIDDPTNQEDVRSPTTMELQEQKIRGVVLDRLTEGGRLVVILTRWGTNDLVPVFKSMGFKIIQMPVVSDLYPWGPTISNKRFPMSKVEQIRIDKTDRLFQMTYMCNPDAMSGNIISREHIRYWDSETLPQNALNMFVGVDPALSIKTFADYSAIATIGLDSKTRQMYLLDMFADHIDAPSLELEIVRRCKRMVGLRALGIETVAYQMSIIQYLKRHHKLPLVELPYRTRLQVKNKVLGIDKDKAARAAYLDQLFISGRLFIPKNLPLVGGISLEAELTSVPSGPHDDRMDALAFACSLADAMFSNNPKVRIRGW